MTRIERLADALRRCDAELRSATVLDWSVITPTERQRWIAMAYVARGANAPEPGFWARFRAAGWFDDVLVHEDRRDVTHGVATTRVSIVKVGVPLIVFGLVGFFACLIWTVVG